MFQPMKSILFATDLSENCLRALEATISLAKQHNASVVLLHVIAREVPGAIEGYFSSMLGDEKWKAIQEGQEQDARDALIGKMTSGKILQKVMKQFREDLGLEEMSSDLDWHEMVTVDRNVDKAILTHAQENGSDLIIMGAGRSFWGGNAIGATIKGVMHHTDIPVMLVP
jgi:nucleotide-binding universal stress UspA family protein